MGGLGNQMFQWAFYRNIRSKFKNEIVIDNFFYKNNTQRIFELDNFKLNYKSLKSLKLSQPNGFFLITDTYNFHDFNFELNKNYYLDGYWQSEKYFKDIRNQIIFDFSPSTDVEEDIKKYIYGKTISLHIRRTDYVTSNGYHPVQTIDYYNKALEIIGEYDKLIIFSDDIEWCKYNLKFKNMVFCEIKNDLHQLWLMSLCKDNIIANSSFSWWGAWLNKNTNKKVIAPKLWFGQQTNINDSDIIPDSWIKI